MTSDGDALFRAICEQPWEDTPRLVYADWLEENGHSQRAEFIRVQIEIARLGMNLRKPELVARASLLHRESCGAWTRGSPTGPGVRIGRDLTRGFYHEVAFERLQVFLEYADTVFNWTPIDTMSIQLRSDAMLREVLASRYVSRLTKFSLLSQNGDVACEYLASCPNLAHLTELEFPASQATDAGAMLLANSPHLSSLARLRLGTAPLTKPTIALLTKRFDTFRR